MQITVYEMADTDGPQPEYVFLLLYFRFLHIYIIESFVSMFICCEAYIILALK